MLASSSAVDEGRFVPGTLLASRYRVAGLLGRGGMGEVYRATDLTLGQAVALKFLPEAASRDDRALARFYNEVRTARQVTHPNVCRVYDVGQVDGLEFISMEYVDGEDLAMLLRRIGRLPVDKAVETARQICAGLAAAHEKGVLHRDLKPANIMIDGRGQAVIMDFGLAGLTAQLQGDVRSGTPAYMSPEQLSGSEVTLKSDIYSLGLLLYELFTGKRAFEAGTLMDLMRLQEQAQPASPTTLVRELDPAVERVVLRCLNPDPKQRPASALAVSAALPGGDLLAAALAAGETPSPELVAAAGETEGMRPVVALAWLAAALVFTVAAGVVGPKYTLTSEVPLDIAPAALAHQSRLMLDSFGYHARPADTAWGFDSNSPYQDYLQSHPALAAKRWRDPTAGLPPLVRFWYRESPGHLVGERQLDTIPTYSDPAQEESGMIRVRTDREGHLLEMEAVPPQKEAPAPAASFDWGRLFTAAGFNVAQWQPADPQWTPLANWDTRAAWTTTDATTGSPLRVEAAAWRGRPVFFRLIGNWTKPERMQAQDQSGTQWVLLLIIYLVFTAACVIAWFNHKQGKGDRRGASALAKLCFICLAGGRYIASPHYAGAEEIDTFWRVFAIGCINGLLAWMLYLALEPWVRRRWPHTMIGWTRYVAKGIRDPLVGRDLLIGIAAGALCAVASFIQVALHGPSGAPNIPSLSALTGVRQTIFLLVDTGFDSIFTSIFFFFLLFVLRVVLRRQWLATVAFVAVLMPILTGSLGYNWIDSSFRAAFAVLFAFILLRFGLLALMVAIASQNILGNVPWSAEPSAMNLFALAIVAAVAIYGFRTSLAGRPLLRDDLL